MKPLGIVLIVLGGLLLVVAGINSPNAPNVSYLIGTFLPGLVCLIIGLKLAQTKKPTRAAHRDDDDDDDDDRDERPHRGRRVERP